MYPLANHLGNHLGNQLGHHFQGIPASELLKFTSRTMVSLEVSDRSRSQVLSVGTAHCKVLLLMMPPNSLLHPRSQARTVTSECVDAS